MAAAAGTAGAAGTAAGEATAGEATAGGCSAIQAAAAGAGQREPGGASARRRRGCARCTCGGGPGHRGGGRERRGHQLLGCAAGKPGCGRVGPQQSVIAQQGTCCLRGVGPLSGGCCFIDCAAQFAGIPPPFVLHVPCSFIQGLRGQADISTPTSLAANITQTSLSCCLPPATQALRVQADVFRRNAERLAAEGDDDDVALVGAILDVSECCARVHEVGGSCSFCLDGWVGGELLCRMG